MYQYKKDGKLLNSFSNISELYNYISKTPRRSTAYCSSEDGSEDFTGTKSLQEAYNLLLYGDEQLYSRFKSLKKISIEKLLGNSINRPKQMRDIVGYQANVPQYLLGLPDNMINQKPKKISQKVLNIALSMSVSAFVSTSDIEKVGNIYIQVIDLLEKAGYRTNLYIICATEGNSNGDIFGIARIKTDREPFNIKKCVFPIMHPSMLRRIFFKYWEVCDCYTENGSDFTHYGYGSVIDNKKEIANILNKALKIDFIVWRFQRFSNDNIDVNVETILKELKKDYGIDIVGEVGEEV